MKIKINNTRVEIDNARRNVEEPSEEFGVENLNPRGQIAKQMEMAARRSIALHTSLMAMLDQQGNIQEVKYRPAGHGFPDIERGLKEALGKEWWRTPTWKYGWEYTVDLWTSGGFRRGIDVAMTNMPTENRTRVELALAAADMKAADEMEEYVEKYAYGVR